MEITSLAPHDQGTSIVKKFENNQQQNTPKQLYTVCLRTYTAIEYHKTSQV